MILPTQVDVNKLLSEFEILVARYIVYYIGVCVCVYLCVYGLTLSILKTKLLVAGVHLATEDLASLELGGGSVEVVKEFKYLGSLIEAHGRMTGEVTRRIAQVSRVFGELCSSVFTACDLSLETK